MGYRACLLICLSFFSFLLAGCNIQRNLLYYPGNTTISDVKEYVARNGLRLWPQGQGEYQGIVSEPGPTAAKGTVVVFHGNGGPAMYRTYYVAALEARGYRVVLAEYPGYGGRSGELAEKSLVADARKTVLRAREEFGGPVYLWGESMGCGVASALATDPEILPKGVVMLTPWDSLLNMGKAKFPWLPVGLLLADTYDNVANLANYRGRVAVIMSKEDEVIPNRLTEGLYASLSGPKRLWTFNKSGHNDWPSSPELLWWDEVMDFLSLKK
jgi:uncharacterized protein